MGKKVTLALFLRLAIASVLCASLFGCADEKDEFLVALANVPRSNTDLTSGITQVVEKRFPPGTELLAAQLFLEERGFKVVPSSFKKVPPGQKWYIAERHKAYKFIHTETIRIIIESDGKQVLKARGLVFLSGI